VDAKDLASGHKTDRHAFGFYANKLALERAIKIKHRLSEV
jgi:hypothetical protein